MAHHDRRPGWTALTAGALLALSAIPSEGAAQAAGSAGPYLQIGLGALILEDNDYTGAAGRLEGSYDVGPFGSVAFGYRLSPHFRVELELAGAITKFTPSGSGSSGDRFGIVTGFLAGYVDVPVAGVAAPYLGLGIGLAGYTARDLGGSSGVAAFAEAGVAIPLSARIELVPALRYTWLDAGSGYAQTDSGWLPKIGLRFSF